MNTIVNPKGATGSSGTPINLYMDTVLEINNGATNTRTIYVGSPAIDPVFR